jgi:hypothetical protein
MSPLHSPQNYSNNYIESVVFQRSEKRFEREINNSINEAMVRGSWNNYTIFRKNLLVKEGPYEIVIVEHKNTRARKLCKIY